MNLKKNQYLAGKYPVIVIGAGHAGCEAALASARMGIKTLLITLSPETTAMLACNPSIGGSAKSTVVREIDALGGAMAVVADKAQIQLRMLNTGKGPAVQGIRGQMDKPGYQMTMRHILENAPNLDIRQGEAASLILNNNCVRGIVLRGGAVFQTERVVLTCGTYLRGRIVIGEFSYASGPAGLPPATLMGEYLESLGLEIERFKTGTPSRVDKNTIDFSKTLEQPGSKEFLAFSPLTKEEDFYARPHMSCWLSYTNEATHQVVRDNLHRSPLYSGDIKGVGPRYCPSFEDKVVRFAHRNSHQVFLEPEGLDCREYYVQGMSSSLPEDVQISFMRTVPGLENIIFIRPGYAIEYDCLQPTQLKLTLEHKEIKGLFPAGQINGTSGYEEAAGQGLIAGINAAGVFLDKPPLIMGRENSYIGVMIDDLVTKGVQEPYRLFTSLSEYRLLMRQDNADMRLTDIALEYGLISEERQRLFFAKKEAVEREITRFKDYYPSPSQLEELGLSAKGGTSLAGLLRRADISYEFLTEYFPPPEPLKAKEAEAVEIALKYEGYIEKQAQQVERFHKLEKKLLPAELDYFQIRGLSNESAQKLAKLRPVSVGQASRITGVSPADINVLLIYLQQWGKMQNKN